MMQKVNVAFNESETRRLPKVVSKSGLFRWAVAVAVCNEKEFNAVLLRDPGVAAANTYMVEKVRKMFGKE